MDVLCKEADCGKPVKARGFCQPHYRKALYGGMTRQERRAYVRGSGQCEQSDCERRSDADRLCRMHYERRRKGRPLEGPPRKAARGAGHRNANGYHVVTVDGRTMLQHRAVMEQVLGRTLLPNEQVHHRNGCRHDNRPENLELWRKQQPTGQRVADLVRYANEITALYGTDPAPFD